MISAIIIIGGLAVSVAVVYTLMKEGKIKDEDGNGIPDVIDTKINDVKETTNKVVEETKEKVKVVKQRVARVKEEVSDVVDAAKEVVKQAKDIKGAASGEARKGRKKKN
jgi:hypothetical protein